MSVFHRKTNPRTQSVKTAIRQNRSRELWGKGAFGGLPAAVAYVGSLGHTEEGTEFVCTVPCASNGHPAWAYWYLPKHGGHLDVAEKTRDTETFAVVPIVPTLNRYGCR